MANSTDPEQSDMKRCNSCKEWIHEDANFCHICKNSQIPPKYGLIRLAGTLAGGLGLISAVVTYVWAQAPALVRTTFGHEANVVALDLTVRGSARLSVQNRGSKSLQFHSVDYAFPSFADAEFETSWNVNLVVEPGKIVTFNPYAGEKPIENPLNGMSYVSTSHVTGNWAPTAQDLSRLLDFDECFGASIHAPASTELAVVRGAYQREGGDLLTVPHELRIRYFSGDAGRVKSASIDGLAVFRWNLFDDPTCPEPWDAAALEEAFQARSTTTDPTE